MSVSPPLVSPAYAEVGDDDNEEDDDDLDFINAASPTFSPEGSDDNEEQQHNAFYNAFKPTFDYRRYQSIYEDKILHTEQLVKLANLSRLRIVEKGSKEWFLSADVIVKFQNYPYYTVILTLCTSEISPENVQLTVCIKEEKNSSSFRGKFRSCTVSLKFLGKFEEIILNKFISFESHGFCKHYHHCSRDELSSVSNYNFEPFDTIQSLVQKIGSVHGQLNSTFTSEFPCEYIPVLVGISINVSAQNEVQKNASPLPNETYSVTFRSVKRKQQEPEKWTKRLKMDESFSDVLIKCGAELNHTFYAHKCVLAARSPVFKVMLTADMKEKSSGIVEIPDVSSTVMESFLALIYETDRKKVYNCDAKDTLEILNLAHRYEISDLLQDCTSRLVEVPANEFSIELALSLFSSGSRFVIPDLEFKGIQCIQQNKEKLRTPEGKNAVRVFMQNQYELSPALLIGLYS